MIESPIDYNIGKWLRIVEVDNPGKKTKRWKVVNRESGDTLGGVYWWSAWRKYIFHPMPGTVYEYTCLTDIAMFVEARTKEHEYARKQAKLTQI